MDNLIVKEFSRNRGVSDFLVELIETLPFSLNIFLLVVCKAEHLRQRVEATVCQLSVQVMSHCRVDTPTHPGPCVSHSLTTIDQGTPNKTQENCKTFYSDQISRNILL